MLVHQRVSSSVSVAMDISKFCCRILELWTHLQIILKCNRDRCGRRWLGSKNCPWKPRNITQLSPSQSDRKTWGQWTSYSCLYHLCTKLIMPSHSIIFHLLLHLIWYSIIFHHSHLDASQLFFFGVWGKPPRLMVRLPSLPFLSLRKKHGMAVWIGKGTCQNMGVSRMGVPLNHLNILVFKPMVTWGSSMLRNLQMCQNMSNVRAWLRHSVRIYAGKYVSMFDGNRTKYMWTSVCFLSCNRIKPNYRWPTNGFNDFLDAHHSHHCPFALTIHF